MALSSVQVSKLVTASDASSDDASSDDEDYSFTSLESDSDDNENDDMASTQRIAGSPKPRRQCSTSLALQQQSSASTSTSVRTRNRQSSTSVLQSSTRVQQSSTSVQQSSTSVQQSSTSVQQSSTSVQQSSTSAQQSSTSVQQSSTSAQQSSTSVQQSLTSTQQASTNQQPSTSQQSTPTTSTVQVWSEITNTETDSIPSPIVFSGPAPGITFSVPSTVQPMDMFQHFVSDDLLQMIVDETNRYASETLQRLRSTGSLTPSSRRNQWQPVTVLEMKAFIAIVINMGLINLPSIADYWRTSWDTQIPFFSKVMSRNRFQIILSHLLVSHTPVGSTTRKVDKIKMFFDRLLPRFRSAYNPSENIAVDETMIGHRGRFSAIQYMPQKPTKWGIKLYSLADSMNGYLLDCIVYTGSETETNANYNNLPKTAQVVMHLVTPYLDTGYHLYTDRFYTSTTLVETLERRNTRFTGTRNNNRKDIPDVIRSTRNRKFTLPTGGYRAFRRNRSLVTAWRPEKKKINIFMLSTGYTSKTTLVQSETGSIEKKPEAVHFYNQFMNGVDMSDQLSVYYSFNRKSVKWWKKVFFWGIEIAIVNSYILYRSNSQQNISQLQYRRIIIDIMASTFLQSAPPIPRARGRPRLILADTPDRLDQRKHFLGKRSSSENLECRICSSSKKRKRTVYFCKTCANHPPLCPVDCFEKYHTRSKL